MQVAHHLKNSKKGSTFLIGTLGMREWQLGARVGNNVEHEMLFPQEKRRYVSLNNCWYRLELH